MQELKRLSERESTVGGPELAAEAMRAGLVDEIQVFIVPVVVGGGTRFLPDGIRVDLQLMDERRFENGVSYLRYDVQGPPGEGTAAETRRLR